MWVCTSMPPGMTYLPARVDGAVDALADARQTGADGRDGLAVDEHVRPLGAIGVDHGAVDDERAHQVVPSVTGGTAIDEASGGRRPGSMLPPRPAGPTPAPEAAGCRRCTVCGMKPIHRRVTRSREGPRPLGRPACVCVSSLGLVERRLPPRPPHGDGVHPGGASAPLRAADRRILAGLPATATVAVHARTGRVRFLGGTRDSPLMRPAALRRSARCRGHRWRTSPRAPSSPATAARAFLSRTATLFGVRHPERDLTSGRTERWVSGAASSASRRHGGRPRAGRRAAGAARPSRSGPRGDRRGAAGSRPGGRPRRHHGRRGATDRRDMAGPRCRASARSRCARRSEGLTILDERILGGRRCPAPRLVWSIDTAHRVPRRMACRRMRQVLVDAADRRRAGDHRPGRGRACDRRICDFKSRTEGRLPMPCSGYARVEGQGCDRAEPGRRRLPPDGRRRRVLSQPIRPRRPRWQRRADGRDRPLLLASSSAHCATRSGSGDRNRSPSATAGHRPTTWSGHEFTHGVLDHEARLFYSYQSGALNEGFADIFGEFIDLTYAGRPGYGGHALAHRRGPARGCRARPPDTRPFRRSGPRPKPSLLGGLATTRVASTSTAPSPARRPR